MKRRVGFGLHILFVFWPALVASGQDAERFTVEAALSLASVSDPRLSPDGDTVAYVVTRTDREENSRSSRIHMVPFVGGDSWPLTRSDRSASRPRFRPDGKALAFLASGEGGRPQIWLLPLAGGESAQLTRLPGGVSDFSWAPDGTVLAVVSMDPAPEEEENEPRPIVVDRLQFKRDGQGYLDDRRRRLYLVDASDGSHRQLTGGPFDDRSPVFSPDSHEIAFVSVRPPDGGDPDATDNSDIFLISRDGDPSTEPTRLTSNEGPDRDPVWSPDGSWLAHTGNRKPELIWYATERLFLLDRTTDEVVTVAEELDRNLSNVWFSGDGRTIFAIVEDSGTRSLVRMPAESGATPETVLGGERVVSSPHGRGDRLVALSGSVERPAEVVAQKGNGSMRHLTRENDALLAGIRLGAVERITFPSADGTEIQGFVTKPPDFEEGRRYPTILWIHGGPVAQFSTRFQATWQLFAARGYLVVAANPRGSSGRGEGFASAIWADWGNLDDQDVNAAVDHVIERGWADPERLGVGGWSYGGILTNYVITKTHRFRAAVSGASETSYRAAYGNDHYQLEWELELGLPWENPDLYERLSPIARVHHVKTPTLVMCGEKDWNVPLSQSENLYQSLRRLGVPTELVIYPGESHGIRRPSFQEDRYRRWLDWYDRFLGEPQDDGGGSEPEADPEGDLALQVVAEEVLLDILIQQVDDPQ